MGRVIAIVNQKGGVGKSTTTINLGAALAEQGQRVLLVDVDPQGNTTSGLGFEKARLDRCIYDALVGEEPLVSLITPASIPGLFLVPATIQLAGAEVELVSRISREFRLRKLLNEVKADYDWIFLDCPPSLGLLTLNALAAADGVLIPIQCEYYALEGLSQLMQTIHLVRENLNESLAIQGVLFTMHDPRTNLGQQVIEEVRKVFGREVFETIIPRNIRLGEAPSFGQPITVYDSKSRGAEAYRQLAREVLR